MLALTEGGTVISWGQPGSGAIGRAGATNPAPAVIPGLAGVQSIAARDEASIAVLASGRIMTWGSFLRPWTSCHESALWTLVGAQLPGAMRAVGRETGVRSGS